MAAKQDNTGATATQSPEVKCAQCGKNTPREVVTLLRHVTTGGAVYLTDDHDFAAASVVIRLDGGPELIRCAEES